MRSPADPPAHDTLEVSVFGKGVGECVVVHLGGGEWLIVDSFMDPIARRPVALAYLESLGVNPSTAVKLVVVSHWHKDHTQGLTALVKECASTEIAFSQALRSPEFRTLLGFDEVAYSPDSSLAEIRKLCELIRDRKGLGRLWAGENRLLRKTPLGDVFSLSPSDSAFTKALEEIRSLIPAEGEPQRSFEGQRPNDTCIVLSVRLAERVIILGADLERGNSRASGWKAIVASTTRPHPIGEGDQRQLLLPVGASYFCRS